MSTLIRKLAWSRLANPRVAVSLSAAGLLLGMLLGATAPNAETLPVLLPLSRLLPSLSQQHVLASLMLYTSITLAGLGLAGMLWAHSQGWRPEPADPAAGQHGHRRHHGLPHPGGLLGHRELRGLRPDRRAGR